MLTLVLEEMERCRSALDAAGQSASAQRLATLLQHYRRLGDIAERESDTDLSAQLESELSSHLAQARSHAHELLGGRSGEVPPAATALVEPMNGVKAPDRSAASSNQELDEAKERAAELAAELRSAVDTQVVELRDSLRELRQEFESSAAKMEQFVVEQRQLLESVKAEQIEARSQLARIQDQQARAATKKKGLFRRRD